jgi:hypothetical protein
MTFFALDDDYSFGILSSSLHRVWLDARCSRLKIDPRYTSTTVFDSFPWPQTPSSEDVQKIASISAELLEMRARYLDGGISLAKQYDTLRLPGKNGLRDLHEKLDMAVLEAYGFDPDEDLLSQLFALNQDLAMEPLLVRGPGGVGLKGARVSEYRFSAS